MSPEHRYRLQGILITLFCLFATLGGNAAHALKSDRQQPIEIEADRVDIDERQGQSRYSGHVRFSQGSLSIQADSITLFTEKGDIKRLLIEGSPAVLEQMPEGKQEAIHAEAQKMQYLAGQDRLVLSGKAEVRQGGNTFRSETIHYNLATDSLSAGQTQDSERVRITIQPPGK